MPGTYAYKQRRYGRVPITRAGCTRFEDLYSCLSQYGLGLEIVRFCRPSSSNRMQVVARWWQLRTLGKLPIAGVDRRAEMSCGGATRAQLHELEAGRSVKAVRRQLAADRMRSRSCEPASASATSRGVIRSKSTSRRPATDIVKRKSACIPHGNLNLPAAIWRHGIRNCGLPCMVPAKRLATCLRQELNTADDTGEMAIALTARSTTPQCGGCGGLPGNRTSCSFRSYTCERCGLVPGCAINAAFSN